MELLTPGDWFVFIAIVAIPFVALWGFVAYERGEQS